MRYRLRTLLIVLAIGPPLLAGGWFASARWRERQEPDDGWIEIGGPGAISHFVISCTFTVDDPETQSNQAMEEKSLADEPVGVVDPTSLDPFGMP